MARAEHADTVLAPASPSIPEVDEVASPQKQKSASRSPPIPLARDSLLASPVGRDKDGAEGEPSSSARGSERSDVPPGSHNSPSSPVAASHKGKSVTTRDTDCDEDDEGEDDQEDSAPPSPPPDKGGAGSGAVHCGACKQGMEAVSAHCCKLKTCGAQVHSYIVCDNVWMPLEGCYFCSAACLRAYNAGVADERIDGEIVPCLQRPEAEDGAPLSRVLINLD